MVLTLFAICVVGGFISGLLGVGGAVVLIPLMVMVPPIVGVGHLAMHDIAGLTMVQVLAASIAGYFAHRRIGAVSKRVIICLGLPMALASLTGAVVSQRITGATIHLLFGGLVGMALIMMLMPGDEPSGEHFDDGQLRVGLAIALGGGVGMVAGIVGAGGGFILIPLMIRVLKVPVRVAIGSSLGVVFMAAATGAVGKAVTLQVDWHFLVPVILGSIPAALLGAQVSHALTAAQVRFALVAVIGVTLVQTWWAIIRTWLS